MTTANHPSLPAACLAVALALGLAPASAQTAADPLPPLRGATFEATETGTEAAEDETDYIDDSELADIPDDPPLRALPDEEQDPYGALGIRLGAFLLYPSIEAYIGHSSNVFSDTIDPVSGGYYRLVPDVAFEADWSRHALRGRVAADHESFFDYSGETTTGFDAELEGRLDITARDAAGLRLAYSIIPENRGDPNVPQAVVNPPDSEFATAEGTYAHRFGRVEMALRGGISRTTYDDALLSDGSVVDNTDRDYRTYAGALRTSVDVDEGRRQVFVEVGTNRNVYDRQFDNNGVERGSSGYDVLVGVVFEQGEPLSGEVGIGYQHQTPDDPTLPDIKGLTIRGSLVWTPSALTTVTLDGSILPEESTLDPTASGARVYTVDVGIEHAFRRNLIASVGLGFSQSDYIGSVRVERDYVAGAGIEYLVSRWLSFRLDTTFTRYESNIPGENYDETRIEAGIRLQR